MSQSIIHTLLIFNYIFVGIFTFEAIIKITAYGKNYFYDNWNRFDFTVAILTALGIILDLSGSSYGAEQTTLIRAFRVLRIFRLVQRAKILRLIVDTMIITLPSMANVGGLLLLIYYIFAILGVQLFSTIRLQDTLNRNENF